MKRLWKHRALAVMALPGFLILFFFDYVAMGGLILAFKNFDYRLGIWDSPWNGLDNFKFLIASKSVFFTITRNTLMYYVIFTSPDISKRLVAVLAFGINSGAYVAEIFRSGIIHQGRSSLRGVYSASGPSHTQVCGLK